MLDFLSWGHLLVIALAAMFIFGPERLPTLAADAGRGMRRLQDTFAAVREQISAGLGADLPGLRDLDMRRYHPRTFLHAQLFGHEEPPVAGGRGPQRARRHDGGPRVVPAPFEVDAT